MALLIAVALFAAQAINFGLILRDRTAFRLAQATGPVATRLYDALEREARGERPLESGRGRVRRSTSGTFGPERQPEVVAELHQQLQTLGVPHGRIRTELFKPEEGNDLSGNRRWSRLFIAVEQPGRGWLTTYAPWPQASGRLALGLLTQTLVLYGVVLLPVLWIARRLSQPLRELAAAAAEYDPAMPATRLAEAGPDDLRQLIVAFNALRLRVTAMLEEKDRMLGAIGHDLRTPLAALRVRIESVEDEHDRAKMADTIAEMNRTLDDILSLARMGRPSEPVTEADLAALVDAVVEDFRDLGSNVSFEETDRLRIRLRPSLMRRAVRNLIENALKYAGAAEVSLAADAREIAIAVSDRGPGIPADRLGDLFEAFTRIEESRNKETGGIGLGLALARTIVRDAGGEVTLENREGGGLIARIVLPR